MKRNGGGPAALRRRIAAALDEPPEGTWLTHAAHHGVRVLLLLASALAVYFFFPAPRLPDAAVLERGVVAPNDVIAEIDFSVAKSEAELLQERADAASGVPPVYRYSPVTADTVTGEVRSFFAAIDSIRDDAPGEEAREEIRAFLERSRITPTLGAVGALVDPAQAEALEQAVTRAVRDLYSRGTLPPTSRESFSTARVVTQYGEERLLQRDSLLSPDRLYALASEQYAEGLGASSRELQRLVLIRYFRPNLSLDEGETEAARARARAAVDPVKATVLRGERVVGAHEQIGEREEERLRAYQAALAERGLTSDGRGVYWRILGSILYNAQVLSLLGVLLLLYRKHLYHEIRAVFLFSLLVVAVAGAAALVARFDLPPEGIPVTFAALIVAVLWDGRLALVLALTLALLIGGQTPFLGVSVPFTAALGGAAAAFSVRMVQRRSKTWLFISIISLAYAGAAITMGMLRGRAFELVLESMGWGVTNAIVSSLLAIGFLPLLESFTRVTTDQTLLELSDTNRPLLRRLQREANGTFHHTINVANLAEAACHAIGAHALLARVGAYYHDVGKLVKPQYFIENQPKGRNPHDKLKPTMSAAIIRSHIVEGIKLAQEERLPEVVRNFIAEHHGTQQISFFYERAKENDPEAQLNPADFCYPGPKPQTRETAVVMLADSMESAARVLSDPTPQRIREMVDRLTALKISTGQLDQSPLTLREIEVVKEQLSVVLAGMYHHRIDYPSPSPAPTPLREEVGVEGASTLG